MSHIMHMCVYNIHTNTYAYNLSMYMDLINDNLLRFYGLSLQKCFPLNPNWHELWKQEKCSSLAPPRDIFYELVRMSIFTSKKFGNFW